MGSSEKAGIDSSRLEWHPQDKEFLLGEGAFGSVYRGTLDITEVAIKVIKRSAENSLISRAPDLAVKQFERELRRLENLRHPHIVQFYGAVVDSNTSQTLIVTELMSGGSMYDAFQIMRSCGPRGAGGAILDEGSFLRVGSGIASGLLYLHISKYIHGDMKPQNVLLNSKVEITDGGTQAGFPKDVYVKITDFVLSRRIDVKDELIISTTAEDYGRGPVGTYAYMAPQAFDGIAKMSGEMAKVADIYAFAIVMYELLSGRQPGVSENIDSPWTLRTCVCDDMSRPSWGHREQSTRAEYIDFVQRCWAQQWQDRPNAEEVAGQFRMWMQDFKSRCLNTSLSVADVSGNSPNDTRSVLEKEDSTSSAETPESQAMMDNDDLYIDAAILETHGFNRFVRHVESQNTCIPEVEKLDFLSPAQVAAEGDTGPAEIPSRSPALALEYAEIDGAEPNSSSRTLRDSFVGAVYAYNGNSVSGTPTEAVDATVADGSPPSAAEPLLSRDSQSMYFGVPKHAPVSRPSQRGLALVPRIMSAGLDILLVLIHVFLIFICGAPLEGAIRPRYEFDPYMSDTKKLPI